MRNNKRNRKQTDPVPRVISRGDNLLLYAAAAVLIALLIWIFFGTIRHSVTEVGILTTDSAAVGIHELSSGYVTDVLVDEGEYVQENDVLVRVYPCKEGEKVPPLEEILENSESILSPVSGYVSQILVTPWDRVDLSKELLTVAEGERKGINCALAYVTLNNVEHISVGAEVSIKIEGLSEQYGTLKGRVTEISELPKSEYDMQERIGSSKMVKYLYKEGVEQYRVNVEIEMDENGNPLSKGGTVPASVLGINKICSLTFYSEERHPYQLLFFSEGRK